jgi:hypothetical protein
MTESQLAEDSPYRCPSKTTTDPGATDISKCYIPGGTIFCDNNNGCLSFAELMGGTKTTADGAVEYKPGMCYFNYRGTQDVIKDDILSETCLSVGDGRYVCEPGGINQYCLKTNGGDSFDCSNTYTDMDGKEITTTVTISCVLIAAGEQYEGKYICAEPAQ